MSKSKILKIIKITAITIISIFLILFIEIRRELNILNNNVSTKYDDSRNMEIDKVLENMPKEQKLFYDSIKKLQFNDTIMQ
ncbi:MAG: hypothetical protein SO179_07345 [Bacteroidales bacterium]|nr:hypothetical protein [Bacteroidales bacterium]